MEGLRVSRRRHPNKEVEAALEELESMGWSVNEAKGRSAHGWGFALCPANAKEACRSGIFCRMSIWSTPSPPEAHARQLLGKANGCVLKGDGNHDRN